MTQVADQDENNILDEDVDVVPDGSDIPQDDHVRDVNIVPQLIEHRPSDDLESLFYIFCEFVAQYGGGTRSLGTNLESTNHVMDKENGGFNGQLLRKAWGRNE